MPLKSMTIVLNPNCCAISRNFCFFPYVYIECHHFCRINNKGQWKLHWREVKDKKATAEGGRPLYLEDDYESAIARNIAVEILKNRYVNVHYTSTIIFP